MSTCARANVGAVIVRDRRALADGFNGNMPGAVHCTDGGCVRCSDLTMESGTNLHECSCVHAEANAIANAARVGSAVLDAVLYCTHRPCGDCTKLIAAAGISRVVYTNDYPAPAWAHDVPGVLFYKGDMR